MKKFGLGCAVLAVLGFAVLLFVLAGAASYNRLVGLSQKTDAAWANVQSSYQRRMDLIPNLVSTVSAAANFERTTIENVVRARVTAGQVRLDMKTAPTDPKDLEKFLAAQANLNSAVSRLLVVSENYPQLKSSSNFSELQAQLEGTENRINVARNDFNDAAMSYNAAIKSFPGVFFARVFGFKEKAYFQADAGAEKAPTVNFNLDNAPATNKP